MQEKPKKTEHELQVLIMNEVRKHPEFGNIKGVSIMRSEQSVAHHPNWSFAWTVNGPALASHKADEIPQRLQREYDLS
jgi:hypothetical protein